MGASEEGTMIKLVVFDLDNTLWDGTIFSVDDVFLKKEIKPVLKELKKRGIKMSICSKNDLPNAEKWLKKFGIDEYFENTQINWDAKSDNIKKISASFSVPFENILFVDDDPFHRAEVKSQIDGINVVFYEDLLDLLDYKGVSLGGTGEDKKRVKILKEQRNREVAEQTHKGNYEDFLRDCSIKMMVREMKEEDWPRIAQLLNRTNELNATCNKYTIDELKKSKKENNDIILVSELSDKFGEYGLIAESIIETKEKGIWHIRDLTVSCRTVGRGIGETLLTSIVILARKRGVKKVRGYLHKTELNWRLKELFTSRGFTEIKSEGQRTYYEFSTKNDIPPYFDWIDVDMGC